MAITGQFIITTERIPPLTYSIVKKITAEAFRSLCNRSGTSKHSHLPENAFDFLTYTNGHMYIDKSAHDRVVELLPFGSLYTKKTKTTPLSETARSHLMLHSDYYNIYKSYKNFSESRQKEADPSGKSFLDYSFQELLGVFLHIEGQLNVLWKSLLINEHYLNAVHSLRMDKGDTGTAFFDIFVKLNPSQGNNLLPYEIAAISAITASIKQSQSAQDLFEHASISDIRKRLGLDAAIPPATGDISYLTIRKRVLQLVERSSCSLKEITDFNNDSSYLNTVIEMIRLHLKGSSVCSSTSQTNSTSVPAADQKHNSFGGSFQMRYLNAMMYRLLSQQPALNRVKKIHFGQLKKVIHLIGKKFYSAGILENADDSQFLTRDEIKDFIIGQSVTGSLKTMITLRKQEYINGEKLAVPVLVFTHGIASYQHHQLHFRVISIKLFCFFRVSVIQMGSVAGEIVIAGTIDNYDTIKDSILVGSRLQYKKDLLPPIY